MSDAILQQGYFDLMLQHHLTWLVSFIEMILINKLKISDDPGFMMGQEREMTRDAGILNLILLNAIKYNKWKKTVSEVQIGKGQLPMCLLLLYGTISLNIYISNFFRNKIV